jgi:hypothetical protein
MKLKIGIDIHGTANLFPKFFIELAKLFIQAGHEIHIVTGSRQLEIEEDIKKLGLPYTHFFSMTDYHESIGTEMVYGTKKNPWMDEKLWRKTKGDYAKKVGLDMMFENQPEYAEHFSTPIALLMGGKGGLPSAIGLKCEVCGNVYDNINGSVLIQEDVTTHKMTCMNCAWDIAHELK